MRRTLPPLHLSRSPLVLVLCQVRFAPVLAMERYLPQIQDRLRLEGYPQLRTTVIQEAIFGPAGASGVQRQRWQLGDRTATRSIVLGDSFLTLQTTVYASFEEFVGQLLLAVDVLASEVEGLLVERIGLRYVDLLREAEDLDWRALLKPELHGLISPVFVVPGPAQLHQSVGQTEHGTLIVRLLQNRQGQVLPPDLAEGEIKPRIEPDLAEGELLTLLDLDHFAARQLDYTREDVEQTAWSLHDGLDRVFREGLVTQRALEAWK